MYRLPVKIVLPNNTVLQFEYDARGNLTKRTWTAGAVSKVWAYQYNGSGQVVRVQGPRKHVLDVTTFAYDAQGNLASVTNALQQTVKFTSYDANGRLLSRTDPNGRTTSFTYDANARLTNSTTGALTTQYAYDADGLRSSLTLADGSRFTYAYDAAHRLSDVTDVRGNRLHLQHDLDGTITQRTITDAGGALARSRSYVFDQRGRLKGQAGNNGQKVAFSYDRDTNVLTIADAQSRTSQALYDALVRIAQMTDPLGGTTQFQYDVNGYLSTVVSPRGVTTQYQRDGFGQVTSLSSPDTGVSGYRYDSEGNLVAATDAKNRTTRVDYDALNRPTQINYPDEHKVSITYDQGANGIGRLTALSDQKSGDAFQYDVNGRITMQKAHVGDVAEDLAYGYTAIGQLVTMQYPGGSSVSYSYAADGKVTGLSVDGAPLIEQLQYQADGKVGQWTWGNGLAASRTFDTDGRLTGYSKAASSASIAYDNVNRIVNLADTRGSTLTQGYAYDRDDRLSNYLDSRMTNSYLYDPDGNRTMLGNGSGFTNYLYASDSNRLLQLSGSRNADLKYDADGNIIADGDNRYKYDGGGRLIEVRNGAGSTRYLYNPLGQRVAKLSDNRHGDGDEHREGDDRDRASGTATYYAYDVAGRLIGEYDRERRQATEYVWMGNVPVAVLKRDGDDPARLYYILTDHLGTPRQVVDSQSNAVVWEWFGEPFGTSAPDEDPGQTGQKFTLLSGL